ncbi:MAG: VWA domain-containing protein [Bacteroidota bacterium]
MNRFPLLFTFLAAFGLIWLSGCGEKDKIKPSKQMEITIQNEFTSLPAKVSIFFKVDYKNGNPVADLTEEDFVIFEKGRNDNEAREISEFEAERRISDNSQIFAHSTVLLLDLSESVTETSLTELKEAAISFVEEVIPDTSSGFDVGVWWFDGSDQLHQLVPFTKDKNVLVAGINTLSATLSQDNSTDLYGAVVKGTEIARQFQEINVQKNIISASSVVIFTDGRDQAGRYEKKEALDAIKDAPEDLTFFTIGLGGEIDKKVLEDIGKDGTAFASDRDELIERFKEIGCLVSAQANSYYLFEYCSPKRNGSGTNELTIAVSNGKSAGSITTEFDATGFEGGCTL